MAITRTPIIDDSGTGQDGTVLNNAWKQELYNQIDAALAAPSGPMFIGDSSNVNNTGGVTINQGAADDEILSLKSSDVAHGRVSIAETDTFATFSKESATGGGLQIKGIAENDPAIASSLRLFALGGLASTARNMAAFGLMTLVAAQHDGANTETDVTPNGNVFAIRSRRAGATQADFLVGSGGDVWCNGSLTPVGGSIVFPVTQVPSANANALDDYREGFWTPTLTSAVGTITFTTPANAGTYTKIGRLVYFSVNLSIQSVAGGSSGTLTLGGLPFSSVTMAYPAMIFGNGFAAPLPNCLMAAVNPWAATATLYTFGSGTIGSPVCQAGTVIYVAGFYHV